MNRALQNRYIAYLAEHGLQPRAVPEDAKQIRARERAKFRAAAKVLKDDPRAQLVEEAMAKSEQQHETKDIHPSELMLQEAARRVEEAIRSSSRYSGKLQADIYVGEFPTGSINSEVVKVAEGFLVLVNSGLMIATSQIADLLAPLQPDKLPRPTDEQKIDEVVSVLYAYLHFGDPFLGPTIPTEQRLRIFLPPDAMPRACRTFVVAHEYAHVLAGHLDAESLETKPLATLTGTIDVVRKTWEQEFEADSIAQSLILGIEDASELSDFAKSLLRMVDQVQVRQAVEGLAAIAAPFLVLLIDTILEDVRRRLGQQMVVANDATHPPAGDRMGRLMDLVKGLPSPCYYLMPTLLMEHAWQISAQLSEALLQTSGQRRGDWGAPIQAATDELEKVVNALDRLHATSKETAVTSERLLKASGSETFGRMVKVAFDPQASVLNQTMLIGQFIGRLHKGRRIASGPRGPGLVFWVEKAAELL
jgi:hypothetical protein